MSGVAPYLIAGLVCGVLFVVLLAIAVATAAKLEDEAHDEAIIQKLRSSGPLPLPPTDLEVREVLVGFESFTREDALR